MKSLRKSVVIKYMVFLNIFPLSFSLVNILANDDGGSNDLQRRRVSGILCRFCWESSNCGLCLKNEICSGDGDCCYTNSFGVWEDRLRSGSDDGVYRDRFSSIDLLISLIDSGHHKMWLFDTLTVVKENSWIQFPAVVWTRPWILVRRGDCGSEVIGLSGS